MEVVQSGSVETVFAARGLTKVYSMGEVEVHALRGVEAELTQYRRHHVG